MIRAQGRIITSRGRVYARVLIHVPTGVVLQMLMHMVRVTRLGSIDPLLWEHLRDMHLT